MSFALQHPTADDGLAVHRLVVDTGVLDVNSVYACCATLTHFGRTSVVARDDDGAMVGFITGYRLPERPDTLFVWQVGVDATARGRGLATRMLHFLVESEPQPRWLETTITPDNTASRALFRGLAAKLETGCEVSEGLSSAQLGPGHAPEHLFRIGPFSRSSS